ncbi:TonB C-terminal domain-containing protein [Hahella aquimaris]|uniref:TonB C-terminal domain-containing protein n=1 Tax=Hahella sp. HNIBRBA332 TaxID=3015983 RepID=UPI00273B5F1B|nr:TonB C-terminal domain-containing protein [Hahella sp. HNIBRBA332]WLQ11543.1 TonB C-terminal domain-containing protein [Hahella sp. HNIBRBA332]
MSDSEFNGGLTANAIFFSILAHAGILLLLFSIQLPQKENSTITVTLSVRAPSSLETQTQSEPIQTDAPKDIVDDTLPWKGKQQDTFSGIPRSNANRTNLSWVSDLFKGEPPPNDKRSNTSESKAYEMDASILELLKSQPSTHSTFWPYLVRHLAQNRLYNNQYEYSDLTEPRMVVLKLQFQETGMLVKAEVERSSGDEKLDAAAIRSAYAANPYQRPPSTDSVFGYSYLVQILYTPAS